MLQKYQNKRPLQFELFLNNESEQTYVQSKEFEVMNFGLVHVHLERIKEQHCIFVPTLNSTWEIVDDD